jgi:hypothetical protein
MSSRRIKLVVVFLFVGLGGLLLVPIPAFPGTFYLVDVVQNSLHGPAFACLTYALLCLFKDRLFKDRLCKDKAGRTYRQVFGWVTLFAVATEVVQHFSYRQFSVADIGSNLLGMGLGFSIGIVRFDQRVRTRRLLRSVVASAGCVCLVLILAPVVMGVATWLDRSARFPVLFEPAMADVLAMTASLGKAEEVDITLQPDRIVVDLLTGPRPGLAIKDFSSDWRGYEELVIEVGKFDGGDLLLELYVRDQASQSVGSDWFFGHAMLEADGWQALRFPLVDIQKGPQTRDAQLGRMAAIGLHRRAGTAQSFAIGKIYLR